MPILVDAIIKKGVIIPKKRLDIGEQDVTIIIQPVRRERALKTKISSSLELVEEVLASEPDMLM